MLTIRLSWQYPKDTSPLIINQNNLKVFRDVFIPQTIAVIEETQITCNQSSLHLGSYTGTYGCSSAPINSRCPSIAIKATEGFTENNCAYLMVALLAKCNTDLLGMALSK